MLDTDVGWDVDIVEGKMKGREVRYIEGGVSWDDSWKVTGDQSEVCTSWWRRERLVFGVCRYGKGREG